MKVLLLSDHCLKKSGVGRVSHDIIKYSNLEWVQLGGAWNEPYTGVPKDVSVGDKVIKVYSCQDYGNRNILLDLLDKEMPDIILHFTDPRFWHWLYEIEFEIRKLRHIPLAYYSIWDNYPIPEFNAPFYNSCDLLIAINKVAYDAHAKLAPNVRNVLIPHGVDPEVFYPLPYNEIAEIKSELLRNHNCKRILFWNNINMRRKNPLQLIEAFAQYYRKYDNECCLVLHTDPMDAAGANLLAVKRKLYDDCNIIFSPEHISDEQLNLWYNIADGVISISYNEGFGLGIQEAAACNCRTIVLLTGGLIWHSKRFNSIAIEVDNKILSGSQAVPFIYQDFAKTENITKALRQWKMFASKRAKTDNKIFTSNNMASRIDSELVLTFDNFDPNKKSKITIL